MLLGLGGLFTWIAFVSGLLKDERKEEFQDGFERRVLLERRTWMAVLLAGGLFLLWASLHGTIVVQSLADDTDLQAMFRWFATPPAYRADLAASRRLVPDLSDLRTWLRTQLPPAGVPSTAG